ncbi:MAG: hypothetical protein IKA90_04680, partial [Clostridia bacterium]|nr:hypothetical protein [Clostridia bacterium]
MCKFTKWMRVALITVLCLSLSLLFVACNPDDGKGNGDNGGSGGSGGSGSGYESGVGSGSGSGGSGADTGSGSDSGTGSGDSGTGMGPGDNSGADSGSDVVTPESASSFEFLVEENAVVITKYIGINTQV